MHGARHLSRETCAEIGAAYTADWRRQFATRIGVAATVAHLAMQPIARAAAAPLLGAFPRLLTLGATLSGKTRELPPDAVSLAGI